MCAHGSTGLLSLSNLLSRSWTEIVPPILKGGAYGGPGLERPNLGFVVNRTSTTGLWEHHLLVYVLNLCCVVREQFIKCAHQLHDVRLSCVVPVWNSIDNEKQVGNARLISNATRVACQLWHTLLERLLSSPSMIAEMICTKHSKA